LFIYWKPIKLLAFDGTWTLVSARKYNYVGVWSDLPGYGTLDLGVSSNPVRYFAVWAKVNNLLDANYANAFDQPNPGREFRLGLSFDFAVAK
jgi:outer membrane cobalamin receptor